MSARPRPLVGLCAGLLLTLSPALAAAERVAKWDQRRVTQYAGELAVTTDALSQALLQQPSISSPAFEHAYFEAREDIRLMNNSAEHLKARLDKGQGYKQTRATYLRIRSLRRDAEENARRAAIPEPLMDKIVAVGSVLNRLAPYYEEEKRMPEPDDDEE